MVTVFLAAGEQSLARGSRLDSFSLPLEEKFVSKVCRSPTAVTVDVGQGLVGIIFRNDLGDAKNTLLLS